MIRGGFIRWAPKDPDEQEFLYSYDPEYELNTDDDTLEKEKIQRAIMLTPRSSNNANTDTGQTVPNNTKSSET